MAVVGVAPYSSGGNSAVASIYNYGGTWSFVRMGTTGQALYTTGSSDHDVRIEWVSGGRAKYGITRLFSWFDVSPYAGNITSLTLTVKSSGVRGGIVARVIQGTAFLVNTSATSALQDYNNFIITDYSSTFTWLASTFTVTLNSTSTSAANSAGKLGICIMANDDYTDNSPGGTSSDDYGDLNKSTPSTSLTLNVTYSTGFSHIVNGVTAVNIDKINGVTRTDIDSINGVS